MAQDAVGSAAAGVAPARAKGRGRPRAFDRVVGDRRPARGGRARHGVVRQVFVDGTKRGAVVTLRPGGGAISTGVESRVHRSSQLASADELSVPLLFIHTSMCHLCAEVQSESHSTQSSSMITYFSMNGT